MRNRVVGAANRCFGRIFRLVFVLSSSYLVFSAPLFSQPVWGAKSNSLKSQQILPGSEALSCEAVHRLGEWSQKKSPGGKTQVSPIEAAVRDRVLERYLELVDPNRVLFTTAQVKTLKNLGLSHWDDFITNRDCSGFDRWLKGFLPQALERLDQTRNGLNAASYISDPKLESGGEEESYPWFGTWASNESELASRVGKFAIAVGETVSRPQLAAFEGNKQALLEFALVRVLGLEAAELAPTHLLARAYIGAMDPFSDYLSRAEFEDFYRDLTGGTSGIGVKLREVPRGLLVQKVLPGSPAAESGAVRVGDIITWVDDRLLAGLPSAQLKHIIEGPEGTPVRLKLENALAKGPVRSVRIVRRAFAYEDAVVEERVLTLAKGRKVGVITIPSFYGRGSQGASGERSSAEDVEAAVEKLQSKSASALVLDLRGNPGGYLEEAVSMAGLFLGNHPVVAVVDPLSERVMRDSRAKPLYEGPLVVLVDEESASAAEILAGALKDYHRAVVMGPTTFGKGSVQRLFHLDSGVVDLPERDRTGVLKLTTSYFYSPLGHSPANGGLKTHIEHQVSADASRATGRSRRARKQTAPRHGAFVGGELLSSIRMKERLNALRLAELKAEATGPASDELRRVFDSAVKRAFGVEVAQSPRDMDALSQGVRVAVKLAELQEQDKVTLRREKNGPTQGRLW